MTENQDVPKTEEMNNLKNEIRQRNAVLIDQQTKRQIRDWLEGNPYQELLEYMKSRVMGQENIAIVVANVYNYLKNVSIPDTVMEMPTHGNCNNMILAAPSGSGKTETYRAFQNIKFYSEHTQGMPLFVPLNWIWAIGKRSEKRMQKLKRRACRMGIYIRRGL